MNPLPSPTPSKIPCLDPGCSKSKIRIKIRKSRVLLRRQVLSQRQTLREKAPEVSPNSHRFLKRYWNSFRNSPKGPISWDGGGGWRLGDYGGKGEVVRDPRLYAGLSRIERESLCSNIQVKSGIIFDSICLFLLPFPMIMDLRRLFTLKCQITKCPNPWTFVIF